MGRVIAPKRMIFAIREQLSCFLLSNGCASRSSWCRRQIAFFGWSDPVGFNDLLLPIRMRRFGSPIVSDGVQASWGQKKGIWTWRNPSKKVAGSGSLLVNDDLPCS